jgi:hypothetical protein
MYHQVYNPFIIPFQKSFPPHTYTIFYNTNYIYLGSHNPPTTKMYKSLLSVILIAAPFLAQGGTIQGRDDCCTTNQNIWSGACLFGAANCCKDTNSVCYEVTTLNWCASHFSGQNCAHAYNEGARHVESVLGVNCGIS